MTDGIDCSEKVAVFITERYIDKVAQKYGLEDTCRQEYDYSVKTKGAKYIIPIVMEPQCRDLRNWHGSLGATLANQMYIDFSDDDKLTTCVEGILDHFCIQGREILQLENGIYRGCLDDDWQPHGFGAMEYKNKSYYEGSWVNGKRSGKGRFTHALGFTYEGDFRDDKKDGFGILTMKNGDKYKGQYRNDRKEGQGKLYLAGGLGVFEGFYKNGKMTGKGTFTYPDGSKYMGEFLNLKINGIGVRVYLNGNRYEGEWKDGMKHGRGRMIFSKFSKYEGTWFEDRMDGEGTLTYENGDIYQGNFKNNEMHGNGRYIYATGANYEGEYSRGKKWGSGKYTFQDKKQYYEGEWENNEMHGRGVRHYKDDSVYEGMFKENFRHGWGKIEFKQINLTYRGEWKHDKMHGHGTVNVENCDSFIDNSKWWKRNPLFSGKIRDVNVTFNNGVLIQSSTVRTKRSLFRRNKLKDGTFQETLETDNVTTVPSVINLRSDDSAILELLSLQSGLQSASAFE